VLDGAVEGPHLISTWRTYVIQARDPVISPSGAVRLETIGEDTHLLTTGGWMGDLRVASSGGSYSLRVLDSKLDEAGWRRLLDDLSKATAALPLAELVDGVGLGPSVDTPTPFIRRLVLRAYADRVVTAWDAIARRPHEALDAADEWTTPDRATVATPGAVLAVMQRGMFTASGPVADRLGGFAPAAWRESIRQTTSDTPENRFARHATEVVLDIALGFPDDDVLRTVAEQARFHLTRPPLRDAGQFRRFPAASRVMRERFGYRELRDAYFALMGSAKVRWEGLENAVRGGLRNTEVLYQYWCFLALQRLLGSAEPSLPTRRTSDGLHVELSVGLPSAVRTPRGFLWHERQFVPPRGTYSVPLRPDFSLAREDGKWDLFDAKFRLDPASQAKHEDIVKMHAYRDAIHGCHAAWVLYPGSTSEVHSIQPREPDDDPSGVGVIALRP